MLMQAEPIFRAVESIKKKLKTKTKVILLCPQGKQFTQIRAKELSKCKNLILICGHYEGIDERVREHLVDLEISIGDYVLTGGELPAMVLLDSVVRLMPGGVGVLVRFWFRGSMTRSAHGGKLKPSGGLDKKGRIYLKNN